MFCRNNRLFYTYVFWKRLKTIFDGWLAVKPKQPIDSNIQPVVCFGTITENSFVLWLSFKWFYNWIRSIFKCFDQSLKAINSLLSFCNKQQRLNHKKTYLSFSLILAFEELKNALRLLWSRESGIGFHLVLISDHSVTSVILLYFV